jgi:hypothetical protein
MIKNILAISSLTLLVSCATPSIQVNLRLATIPEINSLSTVEIGQTIISKAFVKSIPAIMVPNETFDPISPIAMPSGIFSLTREDKNGKYYDSGIKVERSSWELIPHILIYKTIEREATGKSVGALGIFVPSDRSKPAVGYVGDGSKMGTIPILDIQSTIKEEWSQGSFKRELVYTGISKNVISILYREFKDEIARPAFTQDIKYDLSDSKIIGYRGARFEVTEATNVGITYKVLKTID